MPTPPPPNTAANVSPLPARLLRLLTPGHTLYALADAAREATAPHRARRAGLACESLFSGELGEMVASVAPHLIAVEPGGPFFAWWCGEWGRSIGVLLESSAPPAEVRKHFRTLTIVRDPQRRRHFFRFYDPRVLRTFLPVCEPAELQRCFGPVRSFFCEGPGPASLLHYRLARDNTLSITKSPA